MQYRKDKYGNEISILGFGCMRFEQTAGRINLEKMEKQILAAVEGGVNYYDTAYVYPGSETALGEVLARNGLRDKVKIATKLPHYLLRSRADLDRYFSEELSRLQTDYVDYYLMHMLTDIATWRRLEGLGIKEWIEEKKASGQIRQIGFSYHGNAQMFCEILDAYEWEFCQIQYNYLDENSQAGRKGLHYAASKGLPVIIMEPLRGGKLVKLLPKEAEQAFADFPVKRSPAEWAFRWLWNQPEVTCVLSGMNSLEMVKENIQTASEAKPGEFGEEEEKLFTRARSAIEAKLKVGCTGCGYCMPCPHNVDIPGTFAAYNRCYTEKKTSGWKDYFMCTGLRKTSTAASNCVGCGKCEKHCPQHIEIRKELKKARKELEGPIYRIARRIVLLSRRY